MTLDKLEPGLSATVVSVRGGVSGLRMLDMGMLPGTLITAGRRAPLGEPYEMFLRGYRVTLTRADMRAVVITGVRKRPLSFPA